MTLPPITNAAPTPAPRRPEAPRPMFSALAIASSGLSAQRIRMDVVAQNLANAETTRTAQGGPYRRHVVNLEAIEPQGTTTSSSDAPTAAASGSTQAASAIAAMAMTQPPAAGSTPVETSDVTGGVRVASITEDTTPGAMVYDPASPDADKTGYVRMPNVSMTNELMDLMNSRRLYEANATVFQAARAMLHKSIDI